jgi:L-alanine-DL-glutamate epimerase-like enolase superfamily enzyme
MVELVEDEYVARGEAQGVSYHGETAELLLEQLTAVVPELRNDASRSDIQSLLPPGGARNAIDCAFWDLEAKRTGCRAWQLAGLNSVRPLCTNFTLALDTPDAMGRAAAALVKYPLLKLKLAGNDDVERVRAVRKMRPDAVLMVDANQAWNEQQLEEYLPQLATLGVQLIEQPLPAGRDDLLAQIKSPIPLCADESCQTSESLPTTVGKYQFINIKLDKTGGLTEALRLAKLARGQGMDLMVGCMGGSSLAMAPAFVLGQFCSVIDLDGPLWAKSDISQAIQYEANRMFAPTAALWG